MMTDPCLLAGAATGAYPCIVDGQFTTPDPSGVNAWPKQQSLGFTGEAWPGRTAYI